MNPLFEWLGEGGRPVSQHMAESRAFICEHCPLNVEPRWWERVKHAIADTIKAQLEVKNKLALRVSNEERLGMCSRKAGGCGCSTALKVWTPVEFIAAHTSKTQLASFPQSCWIPNEVEAIK